MYNKTKQEIKKIFLNYLQDFIVVDVLENQWKICLETDVKQSIKCLKKVAVLSSSIKFNKYSRKLKSPQVNYADFESILTKFESKEQKPDQSYTDKYQYHTACSYGYKLVCADDVFSKPKKDCLGKDSVYKFISDMVQEVKFCKRMMKKEFNK